MMFFPQKRRLLAPIDRQNQQILFSFVLKCVEKHRVPLMIFQNGPSQHIKSLVGPFKRQFHFIEIPLGKIRSDPFVPNMMIPPIFAINLKSQFREYFPSITKIVSH